jgi:GTP-binding protein
MKIRYELSTFMEKHMTETAKATEEAARKLFAGACDFVRGVADLAQLPDQDLPEIAFAGRSNVGKSSLINALTGRKALARTSHTPGRTQELNYFNIGGRFYLVDMPGYGYAKVSKAQKESWDRLIRGYLRGRATLRVVFVLIDSRHGIKDSDAEIMAMLDESAVPYRIVLTKTDETKREQLAATEAACEARLKKHMAAAGGLVPTSAHTAAGIADLRTLIWNLTE